MNKKQKFNVKEVASFAREMKSHLFMKSSENETLVIEWHYGIRQLR